LIVEQIHDTATVTYISPLLAECQDTKGLRDFSVWAKKVAEHFTITKVAEGSFGEVFKLDKPDPLSSSSALFPPPPPHKQQTSTTTKTDSIFKLIPLRPKSSKTTKQTSLESLLREIQLLKLLDPIPGFARFRDLTVLQGPYPTPFYTAHFDHKARRPGESQNQAPSKYPAQQLWAMIEMDDAGSELASLSRPTAHQIFDVFWQVCYTLSCGEEMVEFEVGVSCPFSFPFLPPFPLFPFSRFLLLTPYL
jgi:serine/threonine-protein kinase haspin